MSERLRYAVALQRYTQGCSLEDAAGALVAAIKEAKEDNIDITQDAAVLLLGAQITFLTHGDVLSEGGISQLMDNCAFYQVPQGITFVPPLA